MSIAAIAMLVAQLLPYAVAGVKGLVKDIQGLLEIIRASDGKPLTPDQIAKVVAARKVALARLVAAGHVEHGISA